jgi:hypothetical protein
MIGIIPEPTVGKGKNARRKENTIDGGAGDLHRDVRVEEVIGSGDEIESPNSDQQRPSTG